MKLLFYLENTNDRILNAEIYENTICDDKSYYYLCVITKYSIMRKDPIKQDIYRTAHGAKIGFGINYMIGGKWNSSITKNK